MPAPQIPEAVSRAVALGVLSDGEVAEVDSSLRSTREEEADEHSAEKRKNKKEGSIAAKNGDDVLRMFGSKKLAEMVPPKEMKKLLPLAIMFFCVLFNYTILRNTKDVLVVTAPGSGAEVIPFLKTYVQLPGAIAFTIVYSKMCNVLSPNQVFYATLTPFLGFYVLFAFLLYPLRHIVHPHAAAAALVAKVPNLAAPVALVRNWSFSAFYLFAELWGSVVLSVLFWGQANACMDVREVR